MLSQLGHILVGVADSMMVGHTGTVPLAAASLGNVIFHVLLTFGIGISYASTPLIAAADGEGNKKRIFRLLGHSFLINALTGVLLFLIVLLSGPVLYYLNQPEEVVTLAIPYLFIVTFSLIPLMVFQTFRQFFEGLSYTRSPMYITLAANLVNVGLNYVFIFGKFGFEPMGLAGAGWASFISRVIMMLAIVFLFYGNLKFKTYHKALVRWRYSREVIRRLLNIGFPAAVQFIFEVGAFGMAVIMMGWLGTTALAAHQIAINLAAITYMMASGLAAAATIRVGNQLGLKDIPNLRKAAFSIVAMAIIFMSFNAGLFILFRQYLPTLYISDASVLSLASGLLIVAAMFQISDGIQVVCLGALRGLEDTKIPTLFVFVSYGMIGLPVGYLLAFPLKMGAMGIWVGLFLGLTFAAVSLFVRFNQLSRKLKGKKV